MLKKPIGISSYASISPLGSDTESVWNSYLKPEHCFSVSKDQIIANIKKEDNIIISKLREEKKQYKALDKTTLLAILAGRRAVKKAGWETSGSVGINIGSSRGATELFETYFTQFSEKNNLNPLTSPTTTLGNISTWLASDLGMEGFHFSHSITCSTALHAVLNGVAWLQSDMAKRFIVGGVEAANTPFTVAQMKALKIYTNEQGDYPCRSMDFSKGNNTMALGEGAALFCLDSSSNEKHIARIIGIGFGTEKIVHGADISANGLCFQESMKMALQGFEDELSGIVMHAPGTVKGDLAELNAIKKIFNGNQPALTSNKWKIGHSLGASGGLSLEMALLMIQHNRFIESPFYKNNTLPEKITTVLINAVGFGGNAVSLLISK